MTDNSMTQPINIAHGMHRFLEAAFNGAPEAMPSTLRRRLHAHLDVDPAELVVVEEQLDPSDHPNIQIAIDELAHESGRTIELIGINAPDMHWSGFSLNNVATALTNQMDGEGVISGPVVSQNVHLPGGSTLQCVRFGLYLIAEGDDRFVLAISCPSGRHITLSAISPCTDAATRFLGLLRTRAHERNIYRGQILSIGSDEYGCYGIHFHAIPSVRRHDVILSERVLAQIDRHTIGFSLQREALLAAGHHLRRGLLLYGPPGTGKTLTAMYIAGQMPDRTTILLTGNGIVHLDRACALARRLQPAMLVIEDVDLIAQERTRSSGVRGFLYQLLNEMDGFAHDDDVIFVLTTNRADLLEPALAARPGRIDLAVEVPLPDGECRRRLFELYRRDATLDLDLARVIERTSGVSGAFIREAQRKATLYAAEDGDPTRIGARHLDAALDDMLIKADPLHRSLLGSQMSYESPT